MQQQAEQSALTRRSFLHSVAVAGAAAGAASVLAACQIAPVEAPAEPAVEGREETLPAQTARIAFVKTGDRAEGVRRALGILGDVAVAGKSVLLKPNFNSSDPAPGSTHPDVLKTLLDELHARGADTITIADRSGMGDTRTVMERLGVSAMAEAAGADVIVLDELGEEEWELIRLPDSHWTQGFPLARCCLDADVVVQTCCLKTHRYGGHFTMSLKNSVGLVAKRRPGDPHDYMRELHSSAHQREMIAEINAAYTPALIVMDGVEAFVRGGPANGDRVAPNVVLAGTDRVAIDAVGVAILRAFGTTRDVSAGPIFQQAQIARAVELGLGVDGPEQIELVTDDAESRAYADEIGAILALG